MEPVDRLQDRIPAPLACWRGTRDPGDFPPRGAGYTDRHDGGVCQENRGRRFPGLSYDQVGAGRSSRLSDPRGYTVERHVADLEAIRSTISAPRLILIGQSWGATLAAHYMAAYPSRVERAVFTSPGALSQQDFKGSSEITDRLAPEDRQRARSLILTPRILTWELLRQINPEAAMNLVSERELDARLNAYLRAVTPAARCHPAEPVPVQGAGWLANRFTEADRRGVRDPRAALRKLRVPGLVLRGACDYIDPDAARQYQEALPNARFVAVEGAGHLIAADQPEVFFSLLNQFLAE